MKGSKALLHLFLITTLNFNLYSQSSKELKIEERNLIQKYEDTLSTLARGILVPEMAEERLYACHQFIPALVRALKVNNSFRYKFPRLENISMIYPADSSFRIFSWQLQINAGEYRYFGAIQFNQSSLRLVPLADRSDKITDPTQVSIPADQWYGVVYYGIKSFHLANKENGYLLLGYDGYNENEHRKVIDILTFKDSLPVFGAKVFKYDKNTIKSRIIYQFSIDAAVRVNYDENEGMIICDHLIYSPGNLPGQSNTMVPEGSYEGFKLDKGVWKFINEVFPSGNASNQRSYSTKPKPKIEIIKNNHP